jgi:hypothetical protein
MQRIVAAFAAAAMVALAPGVSQADPASKAAVAAAFAKMAQAKTYHMTMQSGSRTMNMDVVAPDKRHTTAGTMEMIAIGDDMWIKVNGNWQHMPKMGNAPMPGPMGAAAAGMQAPTKPPEGDVTSLGPAQCQGKPAQGYQVTDGSGVKTKVLIDASGYPCEMDMTMSMGDAVIQWSNWNGPITVNAPS